MKFTEEEIENIADLLNFYEDTIDIESYKELGLINRNNKFNDYLKEDIYDCFITEEGRTFLFY